MRLADRYVLTDRIGVGRMGEVWRATDEVLGRAVAVRVLALPLAAAATLRAASVGRPGPRRGWHIRMSRRCSTTVRRPWLVAYPCRTW
jgi:hypothetical protein